MERKSKLTNPQIVPLVVARIDPPEHAELITAAMRQVAAAASEAVAEWRSWHHERGSAAKIRAGQPCGACFPPALSRRMYARAVAVAPNVSALTVSNALKWLRRTTTQKRSSKYQAKMWRAILAGWENQPCYVALPLRVYCQNARLVLAERTEGHTYQHIDAVVKVLRSAGGLLETTLRIEHPRAGARADYKRWFAMLMEMVRGQRPFAESQIVWERGKFGLRLTVEKHVAEAALDPSRVLFLRAGNKCAWRARFNGRSISIFSDRLSDLRAAREKHIALRERGLVCRHWQRFCRTFNQQVVADLRAKVLEHRVGKVIVLDGRPRSTLASVGVENEREPTNFPIAQFREFLTKSLVPYGCEVVGRANFKSVKRRKHRSAKRFGAKRLEASAV